MLTNILSFIAYFGETVKKVAALPPPFPPRPVLAKAGAGMTADVAAGFSDDLLSLAYSNRPSEKRNRRRDSVFRGQNPHYTSSEIRLASPTAVVRLSVLQSPQTPSLQGRCSSRSDG